MKFLIINGKLQKGGNGKFVTVPDNYNNEPLKLNDKVLMIGGKVVGNNPKGESVLPKLATPQNVIIDGTTLTFDEVENATSYAVLADGSEIGTVENQTGYNVTITTSGYWSDVTSSCAIKIYDGESGSSNILLNQSPPDKTAFPMTFTVTSGKCAIDLIGPAVMASRTSSDYEYYSTGTEPIYFIIDKDGTINFDVSTWYD